jgi:hypothetical protein
VSTSSLVLWLLKLMYSSDTMGGKISSKITSLSKGKAIADAVSSPDLWGEYKIPEGWCMLRRCYTEF